MRDTGHTKRRCSGALLSSLGFCRRSKTVRNGKSALDGKSPMPLAIGVLCGVAWWEGAGGGGGTGRGSGST